MLTVIPAALASAVAFYVLYTIHASQGADPGERATQAAVRSDDLSTEERRELTRQMLRERRENPQVPAEVRPTPVPRPATPAAAEAGGAVGNAGGTGGATDAKPRADRADRAAAAATATPPLPTARPSVARTRTEPSPTTIAALTPPAAATPPAGPAAPAAQPVPAVAGTLPSVVVNAPAPQSAVSNPSVPGVVQPDPPRRGFAANVFSTISVFAGTAANATGNTVNWVIALPGKAIAAGGRLISSDDASSNPPPPTTQPAKRNSL